MSLRRFLSSLVIFAFAMTSMFVAIQPSYAEDDDEPNFMSKLFGSIGILQLPEKGIDFQERPPLVVPPITNYVQPQVQPNAAVTTQPNAWDFSNPRQEHLPPPSDAERPTQTVTLPQPIEPSSARLRNPDFPLDPEVKAAQKKKKQKKMFSRAEEDPVYSGRTLTPDELSKGKIAPTRQQKGNNKDANEVLNAPPSGVQEMNVPVVGTLFSKLKRGEPERPIEFTGEPERESLTQPPTGYLTPSKNAPFGTVTKDKRQEDERRLVHPNMPDYSGDVRTK